MTSRTAANWTAVPDPTDTLGPGQLLERSWSTHPDRVAVRAHDGDITYDELHRMAGQVRTTLVEMGVRPEDRVAVVARNSARFVAAYWGIVTAGATIVPINFRLTASELGHTLDDADPVLVFAEPDVAPTLWASGHRTTVISLDDDTPQGWESWSTVEARETLVPPIDPHPDWACELLYTAGTTGKPKGAVRTHWNVGWYMTIWWNSAQGKVLCVPPLFHIAGLEVVLLGTLNGGGTVLLHRSFDVEEWVRTVETQQVTDVVIVPTIAVQLLGAGIQPERLASVTTVNCAASATSLDVLDGLARLFPNAGFPRAIGSTETGAWALFHWGSSSPYEDVRDASCVGPVPLLRNVRVVDPATEQTVERGEHGEAWVRSPATISTYWSMESNMGALEGADWFRTGDLVRQDDDGYLYVVGRIKDIVISGGENVHAAEVEAVLMSGPHVKEAAVVGVPDPLWGEAVAAVLVVEPGYDESELQHFLDEHLARYKHPRRIELVPTLPRNALGKLRKHEIREMLG